MLPKRSVKKHHALHQYDPSNNIMNFAIESKFLVVAQVKCQAGYRRDPGNPTQDPRWEWRDPALGGGIPPFPPGMKI